MTNKKRYNLIEKLFLILFVFFTLLIIATTIFSSVFMRNFMEIIQNAVEQRMKITATLAAQTIVSGDELDEYWELDDIDPELNPDKAERYEEIRGEMQDFAEKHGLLYVYFMRDIGGGMEQIILDSDPLEPLGLDYTEDMDEYTSQVFEKEEPVCMKLGDYNAAWEGVIAAYAPVFNSAGECVAIVGTDITDVEIQSTKQAVTAFTWTFLIGAILLAGTALALLILFRKKAYAYENASIAKSEFLSRMSHEIRTPMNAIVGFSRLAEKSQDLSEIKPYLKQINESSVFLLQLINSILDISKIEAGKMHLSIAAASPAEIMNNISGMFHNQMQAKNIDFVVNVDKNIPKYIYCDKTYLTQVTINLLSNAFKFTPEKGRITADMRVVESTDHRCRLEISVKDSGIGIKKEFLEKIFEAFEQSDGSITRKYGGTGLGLNISKLLAQLMGGELKVESEEGKGSRFWLDAWFDIVKKEDEPKERPAIPDDKKTVSLAGKTILVFEDNEINQIITGTALEELGAKVEFADNGKIGCEKYFARPEKYDLIFMDIQMPEMDGYAATRLIRASSLPAARTVPIVAMSANVFKEDIEASLAAGMDAHIGKPFEMAQVISTLYNVMNRE